MKVIINVFAPGELSGTGVSMVLLIAMLAVFGAMSAYALAKMSRAQRSRLSSGSVSTHRKLRSSAKPAVLMVFVIAFIALALSFGLGAFKSNALAYHSVSEDSIVFNIEQGDEAADSVHVYTNSQGNYGWKQFASLKQEKVGGLDILLDGNPLTTDRVKLKEDLANVDDTFEYGLGIKSSSALAVGTYEYDLDFYTAENGRAIGQLSDAISTDNVTFSSHLHNWKGGDLIIADYEGTLFDTEDIHNNIIEVGNKVCTTTGRYLIEGPTGVVDGVEEKLAPNKLGCVLPEQPEGDYDIDVSPDNGETWYNAGVMTYARTMFDNSTPTTRYRDAADMILGEVRMLHDTRCDVNGVPQPSRCGDLGNGIGDYRVKLAPNGNLIMLGNLAYAPEASDFGPVSCLHDLTHTTEATDGQCAEFYRVSESEAGAGHPEWGYAYSWCAATRDVTANCNQSEGMTTGEAETSLAFDGWVLPSGSNEDSLFYAFAQSSVAMSETNPVYAAGFSDTADWGEHSPLQISLAGGYGSDANDDGVANVGKQGEEGNLWSSSPHIPIEKYGAGNLPASHELRVAHDPDGTDEFNPTDVDIKSDMFSVRAMLELSQDFQTTPLAIADGVPSAPGATTDLFTTQVSGGDGIGGYYLESLTPNVCEIDSTQYPTWTIPANQAGTDVNILLVGNGTCTLKLVRNGDWQYHQSSAIEKDFTVFRVRYDGLKLVDDENPSNEFTATPSELPNHYVLAGGTVKLNSAVPSRTNYSFYGWKNGAVILNPSDTYTPTQDTAFWAKWVQDFISTDNRNWSDSLTNFTGGDLIIRNSSVDQFKFINGVVQTKIRINGTDCNTSGVGYISSEINDDRRARIGCVLPSLPVGGPYNITVSNNNWLSSIIVGEITYALTDFDMSDDGLASREAMVQGDVRILTDARCTSNGGTQVCGNVAGIGAGKYRVKKMPDYRIWMIDNLAYTPKSGEDYNATSGLEIMTADVTDGSESQKKTKAYIVTDGHPMYSGNPKYGYLYNLCAAYRDTSQDCNETRNIAKTAAERDSIAPPHWKLPRAVETQWGFGALGAEFETLALNMSSEGGANPVYWDFISEAPDGWGDSQWLGTGDYGIRRNFVGNDTYPSPWNYVGGGQSDGATVYSTGDFSAPGCGDFYYWAAGMWTDRSNTFRARSCSDLAMFFPHNYMTNGGEYANSVRAVLRDVKYLQEHVGFTNKRPQPASSSGNNFTIQFTGGEGVGDYILTSKTPTICTVPQEIYPYTSANTDITITLKRHGQCELNVYKVGDDDYLTSNVEQNFSNILYVRYSADTGDCNGVHYSGPTPATRFVLEGGSILLSSTDLNYSNDPVNNKPACLFDGWGTFNDEGQATALPLGDSFTPREYTVVNALWVRDAISTDNESWGNYLINFAGGDLVIRDRFRSYPLSTDFSEPPLSDLDTPNSTPNLIKIGDTPCTASTLSYYPAEGYSSASIGCVIPSNLVQNQIYDVKISNNNGSNWKTVGYLEYNSLGGDLTGLDLQYPHDMRFFMMNYQSGTNSIYPGVGRAILLTDYAHCNNGEPGGLDSSKCGDVGFGTGSYRVKMMPDHRIWMIDNYAYIPQSGASEYDASTGLDIFTGSTSNVHTLTRANKPQMLVDTTNRIPEMGYLYNFCAIAYSYAPACADTLAPDFQGYNGILPPGFLMPTHYTGGDYDKLVTSIKQSKNPIYQCRSINNESDELVPCFRSYHHRIGDYAYRYNDAPWQGVFAGYVNNTPSQMFNIYGDYWTATTVNGQPTIFEHYPSDNASPMFLFAARQKQYMYAARGVMLGNYY